MTDQSFAGRRIAIPESRELDLLASMVEKRGGTALRCPLVAILPALDPQPVQGWLQRFNAGAHDDLILLTGEGLRQLLMVAEAAGCRDAFVAQLAKVRCITRGPKPGRELRELGLKPGLVASAPTSAGIIASLRSETLSGRRVAVQLYGTEPNQPLMDFLHAAGASVDAVAPYRYAPASDAEAVLHLLAELTLGEVDALVFTSTPQVRRLFEVAARAGQLPQLASGLQATSVAAVGPLVAAALQERGVQVDAMPEGSYFLKPLLAALAARWSTPSAPH